MTMEPIKLNTPSHLENHFSFNDLDIVKITKLKTSTVIGICEDELFEPQPLIITIDMGILDRQRVIRMILGKPLTMTVFVKLLSNSQPTINISFSNLLVNSCQKFYFQIQAFNNQARNRKPAKYPDVESVGFVMTRKRAKV